MSPASCLTSLRNVPVFQIYGGLFSSLARGTYSCFFLLSPKSTAWILCPYSRWKQDFPEKGRNGRCYSLVVNLGNAKLQTRLVLCLCVVAWPAHIYFLISLLLSPRFWIPGFEHAISVLHHWDISPCQLKKVKNRDLFKFGLIFYILCLYAYQIIHPCVHGHAAGSPYLGDLFPHA